MNINQLLLKENIILLQFLESDYGIKNYTKRDAFGSKGHLKDWNSKYEVKKLPKFIEDYEIEKLFRTMDKPNDKNIFRYIAIIETFICTGCRRSELLRLKWADIDFFEEEITIRRKKVSNSSVISLPSYLIGSLTTLKNLDGNLSISEYVFRGREGKNTQLSKSAVAAVVKKWENKSNVKLSLSPNKFRHTFITTCFKMEFP